MGTFAPLPPPFFFLLCFHRTDSSYARAASGCLQLLASYQWLPAHCHTLCGACYVLSNHPTDWHIQPAPYHPPPQVTSALHHFSPAPSPATRMILLTAFLEDCPAIFLALMSFTCWLYCFSSSRWRCWNIFLKLSEWGGKGWRGDR